MGPTRLVGGPSSGKTEQIASLAAEWLASGGDARRLVLVVRSREGADELRTRVEGRLSAAHPALVVHTHESLAHAVLVRAGLDLGPRESLGPVGQWLAMREALRRAQPSLPRLGPLVGQRSCIEDAIAVVSACKRALVGPGLLAQRLRGAPDSLAEIAVIAASYQGVLDDMESSDPRDLHSRALEVLLGDRTAMLGWAELMLVDEAEDLSPAQWFLLREMGQRLSPPRRLLLAGHWSESTPGFRGVSSESSSRPFEEYLPQELSPAEWSLPKALFGWTRAVSAALGTDQRSGPPEAAESPPTELDEAAFRVGPAGRVWVAADETEEALAVGREILRARLAGEVEFADIAILVRSRGAALAPLLGALSSLGVPHRLPDRAGWVSHSAVTVALNWLRVLSLPGDEAALLTALRSGPSAVSPAALKTLRRAAGRRGHSAATVFWSATSSPSASAPTAAQATEALDWEALRQAARPWSALWPGDPRIINSELSWPHFRELLGAVELASGLAAQALDDLPTASALAQLSRTVQAASDAQERLEPGGLRLQGWLELLQDALRHPEREFQGAIQPDRSEVSVLTLREAKGRHWAQVFIYGCAAGMLPAPADSGGLLDAQEVLELVRLVPELEDVMSSGDRRQDAEARLFMVGLTRGTAQVTCSWARRYQGRTSERSPLLGALLDAGLREWPAPHPELVSADDLVTELALSEAFQSAAGELGKAAAELRAELALWDPVGDGPARMPQPLSLSATAVASWLACPRQYFAHLLQPISEASIAMTLGTQAHRLLELLYRNRSDWEGQPEAFRALAADLIERQLMPEIRAEQEDALSLVYARLWLGQLAARWEARIVVPGTESVGASVAEEIEFTLLRPAWRLRGKVDALWRRPDGEIELLDYKTSRSKPGHAGLRSEIFGRAPDGPEQWQLPIYQLAARSGSFAEQLDDALPSRVSNWYIALDPSSGNPNPFPSAGFAVAGGDLETGDSRTLTERELDRIEQEIGRQAELILGGHFPAQPRHSSRTCRDGHSGCPVAFWCDGEGSVGAEVRLSPPQL